MTWFDEGKRSSVPQLPPLNTSPIHLSLTPPLPQPPADADVENRLPTEPSREKPLPSPNVWWGRMFPGRAGRDHPFTIRRPGGRARDHYYPSFRASTAPRRNNNRDRDESTRVPAATLPSYLPQPGRGWQQATTPGVLSDRPGPVAGPSVVADVVLDEDAPIPVGDRSQWVRASRAPGPYTPPPPPRSPLRGGRWK
jgi:hypothetical protein